MRGRNGTLQDWAIDFDSQFQLLSPQKSAGNDLQIRFLALLLRDEKDHALTAL